VERSPPPMTPQAAWRDAPRPADNMGWAQPECDGCAPTVSRHLRHALAGLGASLTGIRALLHHLIVAHATALTLARAADLGTDGAGPAVERRVAQHEVRARAADLGAVLERPDVLRLGVLPAQLEAVLYGLLADRVAVQALLDALLHLGRGVSCGLVCHQEPP